MRRFLRAEWREPPAPANPGQVWWDRWLIVAIALSALVEVIVRDDVVMPVLAVALAIGLSFALLYRRSHALAVTILMFGVITAMNIATIATSEPAFGLYTMAYILLVPYALVRWASGRDVVIGLAVIIAGYTTGIAADYTDLGEAAAAFVFAMSPAVIGAAVRYRDRARRRDRDQAVMLEREELARELHDTVAHHVSAIAIQAQAGQAMASNNPRAALEALGVIEAEASKTLAEMRSIVGVLRDDSGADLDPLPGIEDIPALAGEPSSVPHVSVSLVGDLDDVTRTVDATLYRVAREAITNARRHARNVTEVAVKVRGDGHLVRMDVHDDGDEAQHAAADPGFGLVGMNERAKLVGGMLEAGPDPAGGWTVTTILPKDGGRK